MSLPKARILLVDDLPTNLHTLSALLADEYELCIATSGADALRLSREILPDLILLDVMMPQMDGHETLRRIRACERCRHIPVILVTADDRAETQVSGLDEGADDFIAKPVVAPVLKARVRNVLGRRRAEAELRKLSLAVVQSPESIVIADLEGRIEYVNEAFLRITGYVREEIIGRTPRILHSGKTPRATYEALWRELAQGRVWQGEFHNRRKDGSDYVESAVIAPLRQDDGRVTHYVAVKEDVTEKKRVAEELNHYRQHLEELVEQRTAELAAARDAAEAASRAKSAFLANMSHELRTPMNGIMGMLDLARKRMLDSRGIDQIDKARSAAVRLLGVLNDVLDISKIEAERLVLEHAPMQIGGVLENVRSVLAHKVAEKGLALETELPEALARLPLRGDPLRLGQILLNLAGNAIKFTERGGVSIHVRSLTEAAGSVLLRFEVVDTGIGIDAGAGPRIFAAFEQADNSMTRKYGGTGLGLAICKRLVRLMGGEIGFDSTPGAGSTFWFTARLARSESATVLPLPSASEIDAEARLRREHGGARVLLVEDEPVNREVASILLEDAGLVVDLAEDGRQGLELARRNAYALILMDMQMPNMNGLDATRAMRSDSLNRETPILAMTANAFEEDRRVCLAAGMDDHIAKPVQPDRMYEALLRWLSQQR